MSIPLRTTQDIVLANALCIRLNEEHPSDAYWYVSAAGTVWTEVVDVFVPHRTAQVIAFGPETFLLEVPRDSELIPHLVEVYDLPHAVRVWTAIGECSGTREDYES